LKQSKPSWRGINTNNSTCPPKLADRCLRNKSLKSLRNLPKFRVGDLVLHKQRKSYFFYPQTLGIIVGKAITISSYTCWNVYGIDWEPNHGYDYLAVLEQDLEKVN